MLAIEKAEYAAPQILAFFKNELQVYKALEEMSELGSELCRMLSDRKRNKGQVIPKELLAKTQEEVADVIVMMMQMRALVGSAEVDMVISAKIDRTFAKIRELGGVVFEPVAGAAVSAKGSP